MRQILEQKYLVTGSASPSSGTPAPLARLARVGGGSIVKVTDAIIPGKETVDNVQGHSTVSSGHHLSE